MFAFRREATHDIEFDVLPLEESSLPTDMDRNGSPHFRICKAKYPSAQVVSAWLEPI